jgi:diguanylate cyclase (GGDEF)-like protein
VSLIPAVLKRWTWLLVAALVGASALAALGVMHEREADARSAETQAAVFAAEVRDSVREVATFGAAVPPEHVTRVLPPVVDRTARIGERRLDRLDAVLHDPARTDLLRRRLHFIPRLAATTRSPQVFAQRLATAGERLASDADAIAGEQRARATTIARETLAGGAVIVLASLLAVALVMLRKERRHAAELQALADRDPLTGLANRRRLAEDLEALAPHVSRLSPVQLLILDLDGFKSVNDTLGHEAGDALLARFAGALRDAAGGDGVVYRLGGDEFCVVSVPGRDVADAVARAATTGAGEQGVRGSLGLAVWPTEAPSPHTAMRLADQRMYHAKAAGQRPAAAAAVAA